MNRELAHFPLDSLLVMCRSEGLIDGYEHNEKQVCLVLRGRRRALHPEAARQLLLALFTHRDVLHRSQTRPDA